MCVGALESHMSSRTKTAPPRGNRIREARHEAGMTIGELAEAVGTNPSTVSRWETSRDFPVSRRLFHAMQKLGIDPQEFFDLDGK